MALEVAAMQEPAAREAERQARLQDWMQQYGEGVLKLAFLYLKDRHLAEDVFQEVFTRVYLHMHEFRGEASPKTWIYRITANLCHDRKSHWTARRVLFLGEDLLAARADVSSDPEDDALARVDAAVLLHEVLKLPVEYREVVLLVYYEEMTLQEVAQVLGLPPGTVRSRLFRARRRLKAALAEGGWER